MDLDEADKILKESKVNSFIYNVGAPSLAECLVVGFESGRWVMYNWERGQKNSVQYFPDEDTLAREFVRKVKLIDSLEKKYRNYN